MTFLGDDWKVGEDGLRFRHASRVLVFDSSDHLLLAQGHDLDNPTRHWWFTIGGGRDKHEDPKAAAVRELEEETGIVLDPSALHGPVITRVAIFDFAFETVRQYEDFFVAWLQERPELNSSGLSQLEQQMIDSFKWWDLDELADTDEQVYPESLWKHAAALVNGWDGITINIGDVVEPN